MNHENLRKVEYAEISEDEFRKLSPFEKTKAAAKREKRQGYFHGWSTDTLYLPEKDANELPQVIYSTNAIVEQPDGSIKKIKPEYIRFIG